MNQVRNAANLLMAALIFIGGAAQAQQATVDYPNRPVKIVIPFAAGGGPDLVARLIAVKLGEKLGQNFIVDNRLGAGGSVATEIVVRSPADGYTFLFHTGALAVDASFKKSLAYDAKKDLSPVSLVVSGPFYLVANPKLPVKNAAELIAYAKANPKKLNFGSPGIGSSVHLAGELFKSMAGIDIVHVPYKGNSPALAGIMANDIQIMFDLISTSKPLADTGKIKFLGVAKATRSLDIPGLQTIAESGLPGYETAVWMGLLAPANTPKDIVQKVSQAVKMIIESPEVKAQLRVQGLDTVGSSPEEFGTFLAKDIDRYAKVIRDAKIDKE